MAVERIEGYEVLERWIRNHGLTPTGFARRYGFRERDFRKLMQKRTQRRFSAEFVEKVFRATDGAIPRELWIPVRL